MIFFYLMERYMGKIIGVWDLQSVNGFGGQSWFGVYLGHFDRRASIIDISNEIVRHTAKQTGAEKITELNISSGADN